jgi:hypothetical protein
VTARSIGAFRQPDARAAAVLSDELDTGLLEGEPKQRAIALSHLPAFLERSDGYGAQAGSRN